MSAFHTACVLIGSVGLVVGLFCGLLFPAWVIATVIVLVILLTGWGCYKTHFVYHNRYEFVRWSWLCGSVLAGLPIGYLVGLLRWWLV